MLFVLIAWHPWETPWHLKVWGSHHGDEYILTGDSPGYIDFRGWTNPWHSMRSMGYPAFLYPFIYPDQQRFTGGYLAGLTLYFTGSKSNHNYLWEDDQEIYSFPKKLGIDEKFVIVTLAQRVIQALAIAIFYLALCRWFGQVFAFAALLAALCLSPPPAPQAIMTEPLSGALTWLCGAFLLNAGASARRGAWFALACLCAALAFLVRPQTLSLTGLCCLLFLYEVFIAGRKHLITAFFKQAVAFSPLLLSFGYIAWISVSGGHFALHVLPEVQYVTFYNWADAEDAQYMPTERSRKVAEWYGRQKEDLVRSIPIADDASPPIKEHAIGAGILYSRGVGGWGGLWKHFAGVDGIGNLDRKGISMLGKELVAGLEHRHGTAMLASKWQHFIAGFGYYKDVYRLSLFPRATFALNILALALSLGAIAVCPRYRWPLVIMLGIHIMAVLAASLGYAMLQRYVEPTAPFLSLAAFCSCQALAGKAYARWSRMGGRT